MKQFCPTGGSRRTANLAAIQRLVVNTSLKILLTILLTIGTLFLVAPAIAMDCPGPLTLYTLEFKIDGGDSEKYRIYLPENVGGVNTLVCFTKWYFRDDQLIEARLTNNNGLFEVRLGLPFSDAQWRIRGKAIGDHRYAGDYIKSSWVSVVSTGKFEIYK